MRNEEVKLERLEEVLGACEVVQRIFCWRNTTDADSIHKHLDSQELEFYGRQLSSVGISQKPVTASDPHSGRMSLKIVPLAKITKNIAKHTRYALKVQRDYPMTRRVSEAKLKEIQKIFFLVDTDHSGAVDAEEFRQALLQSNRQNSRVVKGLAEKLKLADLNNDGKVTFREVLKYKFTSASDEEIDYMYWQVFSEGRRWQELITKQRMRDYAAFWNSLITYTKFYDPEKKSYQLKVGAAVLSRVRELRDWIGHWDRKVRFHLTGNVTKRSFLQKLFPDLSNKKDIEILEMWEQHTPRLKGKEAVNCKDLFWEMDPNDEFQVSVDNLKTKLNLENESMKRHVLEELDPEGTGFVEFDRFENYFAKAWSIKFFDALLGKV